MPVLLKDRINGNKKKKLFPVTLKVHISNTNSNNIKLQMLQEGLKCKHLEEKIQSIYHKESFI